MIRSYRLRKHEYPISRSNQVAKGTEENKIPNEVMSFMEEEEEEEEDIQHEKDDADDDDAEYSERHEIKRRRKKSRSLVSRKERKNSTNKSSLQKSTRTSKKSFAAYSERTESRVKNISKKIREGNDCTILGIMARRFSKLLQSRPGGTISFLEATEVLDLNPRRLYDILHVLDGAGLITISKRKVNSLISWKASSCGSVRAQLHSNRILEQEMDLLDAWTNSIKRYKSKREIDVKGLLYINKNDLFTQRRGHSVDLILAPEEGSILQIPNSQETQSKTLSPMANGGTMTPYFLRLLPPSRETLVVDESSDMLTFCPESTAKAFIMEETGVLKNLPLLGSSTPPLLARCCSDFSLLNIEPPRLTPCNSDWTFQSMLPMVATPTP